MFGGLSLFPAIHAFAFGGIGMITLSMMSRVSLAHTGRAVSDLPRKLSAAFLLLGLGALLRVLLPLVDTSHYLAWIVLSQALWMAAFALFVMLVSPRVDGKPG